MTRRAALLRQGTVLAAAGAVMLALAATPRAAGGPSPKLTTVLGALATAVPQDRVRTQSAVAVQTPLALDSLPAAVRDALTTRRLRINDRNEVQVHVLMTAVNDDGLQQLRDLGATVELSDTARRRVQVRVPASSLEALAALPIVSAVRLPSYARHRAGKYTTEGDAIVRADALRAQVGVDGTGVRVGVISDGIKGMFAQNCTSCGPLANGPLATSDLPSSTGTRNSAGVLLSSSGGVTGRSFTENGDLEGLPPATPLCAYPGAGAEGTALLEVVHDVAPGAQLSFANADTDLAFVQAVDWLASTNDVVVDDLGFFGLPLDGTSSVSAGTAASLNKPNYPIRGYYTSVGNEADAHYYGTYTDSGVDGSSLGGVTNPGRLHLFQRNDITTDILSRGPQPFNEVRLARGGEIVVFLQWDDEFGASKNNYDLYLVAASTGKVVASSTDLQTGSQDPVEALDFVATATDTYRIVVQNVNNAAAPKHLSLFPFQPQCASDGPRLLISSSWERLNFNTATYSIAAQSDAGGSPASVVSVGAICSASAQAAGVFGVSQPDASCLDRNHATAEFFSSRGPTTDGRMKPDVSSIDGVAVSGSGGFSTPFFGTSAAAPHVAGIAALVLQATPCLLPGRPSSTDPVSARTGLRNLIVKGAVPLASPSPDNTFGSGRADAVSALQAAIPAFTGSSSITVQATGTAGATLNAAQLGFTDLTQCGNTKLQWTGACGTGPAATMTCPTGTNTVSVAASSDGTNFSTPVQLTITVK